MPSAPSAAAEVQRAKKQPRAAPGRGRRCYRNVRAPAVRHRDAGKWCERVPLSSMMWRLACPIVAACVPGKALVCWKPPLCRDPSPPFLEAQLLYALAGARGRLHVSEVDDAEPGEGAQNPLERYPVGAALRAVVLEQPSSRAVRFMVKLKDFSVQGFGIRV